MPRFVLPLMSLVVGCASPEQGLWSHSVVSPGIPSDVAGLDFVDEPESDPPAWTQDHLGFPGDPGDAEEIEEVQPEIEMSLEAVLQRNRWGGSLGRCQIEVAFREKSVPTDPAPQPTSTPTTILLPTDPGSCAFTALAPMEAGLPMAEGSGSDDWELEGSLSGSEVIYLHSPTTTLTLHRQALDGGRVRYELPSCTIADFPFSQVFDLEVPALEGAAIPGFYVEDALAVGPDLIMAAPVVSLSVETLFHPVDEPLYAVWDDSGPPPVVLGDWLDPARMIFVRNHRVDEHQPFEALACRPPDRQMTLDPDTLAALWANPDAHTEHFYLAFQVDTTFSTPAFEAPWGQTVFARSTVSESGDVHLYEVD